MKRYTVESCHEIGNRWEIDAPEGLTPEEVEKVHRALCEYTNEYHSGVIDGLITDAEYYLEDFPKEKLPLLRQITFYVETVHREVFTQPFKEE